MPNLLSPLPPRSIDEAFTEILTRPGIRIERIVSWGQATPEGEWYDQGWDEWVLLLTGSAGLLIEGQGETVLGPGDHVMLPARLRHRVSWTDDHQPTVWLAVHLGTEMAGSDGAG
ncbi:cupin domain-containing protein [Tistrella mobilis]|uniref:Cupin type-2 domain-containing protein n=1 Tax=Tistrella mobilis (strain KA081020-065) TaxID=1110502 RepID=I3TV22_TISMK|nr:cupin domain-containing protein [Tistrella mobilis]AFK56610.1 hypothetical protein TMO_b0602 [Tistrella mobilis KA081020-065]